MLLRSIAHGIVSAQFCDFNVVWDRTATTLRMVHATNYSRRDYWARQRDEVLSTLPKLVRSPKAVRAAYCFLKRDFMR